jgi:hypothetical protein
MKTNITLKLDASLGHPLDGPLVCL